MMKKANFLLVSGQNLGGHWIWASAKFGECICSSIYTCFAFCLFVSLFFGDTPLVVGTQTEKSLKLT